MKANEFVKKFGWGEAKVALMYCKYVPNGDLFYKNIDVSILELKRLVESHELMEKYKNRHGGIRFRIRWGQFRYGDTQEFNDRLKQAVADVESCR